MENQINVGIQRQPYEPFGTTDSEAENSGAETSFAGDSAGANTSGNPDVVQPHIEGESINPASPETLATNNLLNRYGISDGIIIQRPDYTFNNPAAPDPTPVCPVQTAVASSGLETTAAMATKPPGKAPADTTSYAKDATNNSAPAKSHGIVVPPHDSVAYAAARDYGAQHGYETWQTDQVAAVLVFFGGTTPEQCAKLLADGGLPFHITSITQAMGDPRADGTFDIGYALRSLQETQAMMNGDPNAGNRNLPDGRAADLGGAQTSSRGSVGQGFLDYAIEMTASSGTSDIASIDFSDEPYDASNASNATDNTPQPNFDPLSMLPPVDANGPIMLPTPEVQVDHELAPIPPVAIAEETNPRTPVTDVPDARTESAANEQVANVTGAGGAAAASNPPLTLNPETGQYGRDYGNGVWTYPLETPRIESHNLLATNNTDTIRADPGLIANLSSIYQAYEQGQISLSDALSMARGNIGYSARATNAEYSVTTRLGGAAQAAGGFVEALVGLGLSDTIIGAVIGVPIALHGTDNMVAGERTMVEGNHVPTLTVEVLEYAGMSPMAAELTNAGLGLVGTLGPGAVRAVGVGRALQAEETAALNLQRAEELAAARLPSDVIAAEVNTNRINVEANGVRTVEAREPVDLNGFDRLNQIDTNVNRLRPGEAGAATELENYLGETLERITNPAMRGDFVITTGEDAGKTVDFMLTPGSAREAEKINEFFVKNADGFMSDLTDHVNKADIVCLDMRFLTQENQSILLDMVNRLTPEQRAQIILIK
jgi:CdiA C-terminal tRNase domain